MTHVLPIVRGKEQIPLFHVDDLKLSHKDSRVNGEFETWIQKNYGQQGRVAQHCGKIHEYLGMEIDYLKKGKVKFGMINYVESLIKDFPMKLKSTDSA